jgi:hypothetical protein
MKRYPEEGGDVLLKEALGEAAIDKLRVLMEPIEKARKEMLKHLKACDRRESEIAPLLFKESRELYEDQLRQFYHDMVSVVTKS